MFNISNGIRTLGLPSAKGGDPHTVFLSPGPPRTRLGRHYATAPPVDTVSISPEHLKHPVGRMLSSLSPPQTKRAWKKSTLGRYSKINVLFAGLPAIPEHVRFLIATLYLWRPPRARKP
jgi:hypothetical protein